MERARRIADLWNWLPAFRAVAEYESIHKAALVVHVSPSSLSRTIKLLEEAVGAALFVRTSTGLALTPFGAGLLKATREAMRRIDDALEAGGANDLRATTLVASARSPILQRLIGLGAARFSGTDRPRLRLSAAGDDAIVEQLLRGHVDLVVVEDHLVPELPNELESTELGKLTFALHAVDGELPEGGSACDRVVVVGDMKGANGREVVATADSIGAAEMIAASGPFLALLPTVLASPQFRVVGEAASQLAIVGVKRRALGERGRGPVDVLVDAIRDVLGS